MIILLLLLALLVPVKNAQALQMEDSGKKASFSDVPSMDMETDVVDYRTGNESKDKQPPEDKKEEKPEPKGEEKSAPSSGSTFKPDMSGVKGSFSEVPIAETDTDPIDYRTGEEDAVLHKVHGLKKKTEEKKDDKVSLKDNSDPFADHYAHSGVNARDIQGRDSFHEPAEHDYRDDK